MHEFAAHRLQKVLRFLPSGFVSKVAGFAERKILDGAVLYYKMPKVVLAPNQELVDLLGKGTHRVSKIMSRGVDTEKFSPDRRTVNDGIFRLGFVGRLRAEKSVRMLVDLERELLKAGRNNFKFLIVGEGNEREYLEKNLQNFEMTGFLDGAELSEAYANMDVFIFPSKTDAFGNVTQEAFASGVPAIVTDQGGPKFLVKPGETGFIAKDLDDFVKFTIELMDDPAKLLKMKENARAKRDVAVMGCGFRIGLRRIPDGLRKAGKEYQEIMTRSEDIHKSITEAGDLEDIHDREIPVAEVLRSLFTHPLQIITRWNWKAAFIGATLRASFYFTVYQAAKENLRVASDGGGSRTRIQVFYLRGVRLPRAIFPQGDPSLGCDFDRHGLAPDTQPFGRIRHALRTRGLFQGSTPGF